jgi:hypothetical protein
MAPIKFRAQKLQKSPRFARSGSTKPAEYFRSTPGGYFNAMVARAKGGTLNLSRSIWGLKEGYQAPQKRKGH